MPFPAPPTWTSIESSQAYRDLNDEDKQALKADYAQRLHAHLRDRFGDRYTPEMLTQVTTDEFGYAENELVSSRVEDMGLPSGDEYTIRSSSTGLPRRFVVPEAGGRPVRSFGRMGVVEELGRNLAYAFVGKPVLGSVAGAADLAQRGLDAVGAGETVAADLAGRLRDTALDEMDSLSPLGSRAQRISEALAGGSTVGAISLALGYGALDTTGELSLLRGLMGGITARGAKGAAAGKGWELFKNTAKHAAGIAALRAVREQGPLSERLLRGTLAFAYMATPGLSQQLEGFWSTAGADMVLNSLISAGFDPDRGKGDRFVRGGQYKSAWERAKQKARKTGSSVWKEFFVEAIPLLSTDALFSLATGMENVKRQPPPSDTGARPGAEAPRGLGGGPRPDQGPEGTFREAPGDEAREAGDGGAGQPGAQERPGGGEQRRTWTDEERNEQQRKARDGAREARERMRRAVDDFVDGLDDERFADVYRRMRGTENMEGEDAEIATALRDYDGRHNGALAQRLKRVMRERKARKAQEKQAREQEAQAQEAQAREAQEGPQEAQARPQEAQGAPAGVETGPTAKTGQEAQDRPQEGRPAEGEPKPVGGDGEKDEPEFYGTVEILPGKARTRWRTAKILQYAGHGNYLVQYYDRRRLGKQEQNSRVGRASNWITEYIDVSEGRIRNPKSKATRLKYKAEVDALPEEDRKGVRAAAREFDSLVKEHPVLFDWRAQPFGMNKRAQRSAEYNEIKRAREAAADVLDIEDDIHSPVTRARHLEALKVWMDGPGRDAARAELTQAEKERIEGKEPQSIYAVELRDGDQVRVGGDWLIADVDDAEGTVTLHDGTTIRLEDDDRVEVAGGEIVGSDGTARQAAADEDLDASFDFGGEAGPRSVPRGPERESGATGPRPEAGAPRRSPAQAPTVPPQKAEDQGPRQSKLFDVGGGAEDLYTIRQGVRARPGPSKPRSAQSVDQDRRWYFGDRELSDASGAIHVHLDQLRKSRWANGEKWSEKDIEIERARVAALQDRLRAWLAHKGASVEPWQREQIEGMAGASTLAEFEAARGLSGERAGRWHPDVPKGALALDEIGPAAKTFKRGDRASWGGGWLGALQSAANVRRALEGKKKDLAVAERIYGEVLERGNEYPGLQHDRLVHYGDRAAAEYVETYGARVASGRGEIAALERLLKELEGGDHEPPKPKAKAEPEVVPEAEAGLTAEEKAAAEKLQAERDQRDAAADEVLRLQKLGEASVPGVRLEAAERTGRMKEMLDRGEVTQEQWDKYVEELYQGDLARVEVPDRIKSAIEVHIAPAKRMYDHLRGFRGRSFWEAVENNARQIDERVDGYRRALESMDRWHRDAAEAWVNEAHGGFPDLEGLRAEAEALKNTVVAGKKEEDAAPDVEDLEQAADAIEREWESAQRDVERLEAEAAAVGKRGGSAATVERMLGLAQQQADALAAAERMARQEWADAADAAEGRGQGFRTVSMLGRASLRTIEFPTREEAQEFLEDRRAANGRYTAKVERGHGDTWDVVWKRLPLPSMNPAGRDAQWTLESLARLAGDAVALVDPRLRQDVVDRLNELDRVSRSKLFVPVFKAHEDRTCLGEVLLDIKSDLTAGVAVAASQERMRGRGYKRFDQARLDYGYELIQKGLEASIPDVLTREPNNKLEWLVQHEVGWVIFDKPFTARDRFLVDLAVADGVLQKREGKDGGPDSYRSASLRLHEWLGKAYQSKGLPPETPELPRQDAPEGDGFRLDGGESTAKKPAKGEPAPTGAQAELRNTYEATLRGVIDSAGEFPDWAVTAARSRLEESRDGKILDYVKAGQALDGMLAAVGKGKAHIRAEGGTATQGNLFEDGPQNLFDAAAQAKAPAPAPAPEPGPKAEDLANVSEEDLDRLFDEVLEEQGQAQPPPPPEEPGPQAPPPPRPKRPRSSGGSSGGQSRPRPKAEPKAEPKAKAAPKSDQRDVDEILRNAARHGVKGATEAMKGLYDLFGGSKLHSGFPGIDVATYREAKPHFEAAFREFAAAGRDLKEFLQFLVGNFGAGIRPYVKAFQAELAGRWKLDEEQARDDGNGGRGSLEQDRGDAEAGDRVGEGGVPARSGADGRTNPGDGGRAEGDGGAGDRGPGVHRDDAAAGGERGDQPFLPGTGGAGIEAGASGAAQRGGGGGGGQARLPSDAAGAGHAAGAAGGAGGQDVERDERDRLSRQRKADSFEIKPGDLENIRRTLPVLFPEQHEDVARVERRYADTSADTNRGMLVTNGTGTGKTYTGLGVIKRFVRQGKGNVLIVTPKEEVCTAWERSGKDVLLDIQQVPDTKSAGEPGSVMVTTFANFAQNAAVAKRDWDLLVFDEAHYLGSNQEGDQTLAWRQMDLLTANERTPRIALARYADDLTAVARELDWRVEAPQQVESAGDWRGIVERRDQTALETLFNRSYWPQGWVGAESLEGRVRWYWYERAGGDRPYATPKYLEKVEALVAMVEATQGNPAALGEQPFLPPDRVLTRLRLMESDPATAEQEGLPVLEDKHLELLNKVDQAVPSARQARVLFLSASPWAYRKNVLWGDGFLFATGYLDPDRDPSRGYNEGDPRQQFMMAHFGYRMRYNRLNEPGRGVDDGVMERQFHEWLRDRGALWGRTLEVDRDFSREFVDVPSRMGADIEAGLALIRTNEAYKHLREPVRKKYSWHYTLLLMEALKADAAIDRIRKHLELGRKVVVFHSRNNGIAEHPFALDNYLGLARNVPEARRQWAAFKAANPHLVNMQVACLANAPDRLAAAFGDAAAIVRGGMSPKRTQKIIDDFQDPNGRLRVVVAQVEKAKEGLSFHDLVGDTPRVEEVLCLPLKPMDLVQVEGRVSRLGMKSNAVIEYLKTGLSLESWAFAEAISARADTAENLAMGNRARRLREAIRDGYLNSISDDPHEGQGVGGREADGRADAADFTPFDAAITHYHARQQRRSRRRGDLPGVDFFPTPEPLGYKMVEWLGLKPGDKFLEPSAGDGAIARYATDATTNHLVEPSYELATRLAAIASGTVRTESFEDYPLVNKFNGIAMNPPYGHGAKTAIEHLSKAFKHLKPGGRVIAIIPEGSPSIDGRFDSWYENEPEAVMVKQIGLPRVTFTEKAGTSVKTRVVVVDRVPRGVEHPDASGSRWDIEVDTVEDLFARLRDMEMPERLDILSDHEAIERAGLTIETKERKDADPLYILQGEGAVLDRYKPILKDLQDGRWSNRENGWVFGHDPSEFLGELLRESLVEKEPSRDEREALRRAGKVLEEAIVVSWPTSGFVLGLKDGRLAWDYHEQDDLRASQPWVYVVPEKKPGGIPDLPDSLSLGSLALDGGDNARGRLVLRRDGSMTALLLRPPVGPAQRRLRTSRTECENVLSAVCRLGGDERDAIRNDGGNVDQVLLRRRVEAAQMVGLVYVPGLTWREAPFEEPRPEGPAPGGPSGGGPGDRAAPEVRRDPGQEFAEGDRVVVEGGAEATQGRHGVVANVTRTTSSTWGSSETRTTYYYTVRTDAGASAYVGAASLRVEDGDPPEVVPDVQVGQDEWRLPGEVLQRIARARKEAREAHAAELRARKPASQRRHQMMQQEHQATEREHRGAWDQWAKANPEAAQAAIEADQVVARAAGVLEEPAPSASPTGAGPLRIGETVHAKKGHKVWVAALANRVDTQEYARLKALATEHGGYWSSYHGQGAIPGFQFTDPDAASAFMRAAYPQGAQYAVGAPVGSPLSREKQVARLRKVLPGAKVDWATDEALVVTLPNGRRFGVLMVPEIRIDEKAFEAAYGRLPDDTDLAAGAWYSQLTIMQLAGIADASDVDHESWHMAKTLADLTDKELEALRRKFGGDEEAEARAYSEWNARADRGGDAGVFARIWGKVRAFFSRIAKALGLRRTSAEDVFSSVRSGEVWERGDQGEPPAEPFVRYSVRDVGEAVDRATGLLPVQDEGVGYLLRRYLLWGRHVGARRPWLNEADFQRRGSMEADRHLAAERSGELREALGDLEKLGDRGKAVVAELNRVLRGEVPAAEARVGDDPSEQRALHAVEAARRWIDELSTRIVGELGKTIPESLGLAIMDRRGKYVIRAYEKFADRHHFRPEAEAVDNARQYLLDELTARVEGWEEVLASAKDKYRSSKLKEILAQFTVTGNEALLDGQSATFVRRARRMRAFYEAASRRLNGWLGVKVDESGRLRLVLDEADAGRLAEGALRYLLDKDTELHHIYSGRGPSPQWRQIRKSFMARKDIPGPIRRLWGEITDIGAVVQMTTMRQMQVLTSNRWQREILAHSDGLPDGHPDKLFYKAPHVSDGRRFSFPVSSPTFGVLNGWYTDRATFDMLAEVERLPFGEWWMKAYMTAVVAPRYTHTVLNPPTVERNFLTNFRFALAEGEMLRPVGYLKAWGKAVKGIREGGEAIREAMRAGVVSQSANAAELRATLEEAFGSESMLTPRDFYRRLWAKVRHGGEGLSRLYALCDNIHKLVSWQAKLDRGMDPAEAARQVREAYPYYDMSPLAVTKGLRRAPVMPDFVTFKVEALRVAVNNWTRAAAAAKSGDLRPALGTIAAQGAATRWGQLLLGAGATAALALLQGDADGYAPAEADEQDAMRTLLPEYRRDGNLVVWRTPDGKLQYLDASYISPDAMISMVSVIAGSDQPVDEKMRRLAEALREEWIGIPMGVEMLGELASNRNSRTGEKIYSEGDTFPEAVGKWCGHALGRWAPSSAIYFRNAAELYAEGGEAETAAGELRTVGGEVGKAITPVRVYTFDAEAAFSARMRGVARMVREIKMEAGSARHAAERGYGSILDSDEAEISADRHLVETVTPLALSYIDAAGRWLSPRDMVKLMREAGLSEADARALATGRDLGYVSPR